MPKPEEQGLIWITEAMVRYKHSRNWFNNRIRRGELETVPFPGTSKVYLRVEQVERYLREHPAEKGMGQ